MLGLLKIIVSKLGGIDVSEKNHVDEFTENKMATVAGEKIASSRNGGIWIEFQELSEFNFMNIIVIGNQKLKTFEGCEMDLNNENSNFKLISDTREIESDYSNVSNRWITNITFDVTDCSINEEITKTKYIKITAKNYSETFEILK